MTESIIGICVPLLESTLTRVKERAGTRETKKAISMAIDAYIAEKKEKKI